MAQDFSVRSQYDRNKISLFVFSMDCLLMGQCHEIFDPRFFINQPPPPSQAKAVCIWLRIRREI
jgi:hypothetical protein